MKDWLTVAQFASAEQISERAVHHRIKARDLETRRAAANGRGRPGYEISSTSLSSDGQRRLLAMNLVDGQRSTVDGEELAVSRQPSAVDQASLFVQPARSLPASPEADEQARRRFEVLAPLADFRSGKLSSYATHDGKVIRSESALLRELARQHELSESTLWEWWTRFKQGGYAALADRARSDKGKSRFFAEYPKARDLVEAWWLQGQMSITQITEAIARQWPQLYNHGSEPPSYTTVRQFLQSLPKPVSILAREGVKKFEEKCTPILVRDPRKIPVNDWWIGDHSWHDVWVWNDGIFDGVPRGHALRPWLTVWADMHSRVWVGPVWNATPSSYTIASSLRVGLERRGIPRHLYIDNGRDYQKVTDIERATGQVLAALGIEWSHCTPYHPQAKAIESYFRTVRCRFDNLWPSYCGPSPAKRPERCEQMLDEHKQWLQGKLPRSPLPRLSEFLQAARFWIEDEFNAGFAHSGLGMEGRTPNQAFEQDALNLRRLEADSRVLDMLFWEREKRQVIEGPAVRINRCRYRPADAASANALFHLMGREVLIACDPLSIGEAIALDQDGHFLGRLVAQELVVHGPTSREASKAITRLRRRMVRDVKRYSESIAALAPTGLEMLYQRAGIQGAPAVEELPEASGAVPMLKRLAAGGGRAVEPSYSDDLAAEVRDLMSQEGD